MSVDDLSEEQVAEFKDAFELFDKVDFEISQNLFFFFVDDGGPE
jgi:hypothetical protein